MEKSNKKMGLIVAAILALVVAGGVVAFSASSDDDTSNSETTGQSEPGEQSDATSSLPFNLNLTNLAPLTQGVYEGWVVRGDDKTSFGRFNTTESGGIVGDLSLESLTVQDGDTIAISIEPDNDVDPGPSATIVLAGMVENGSASLAFPVDISGFAGQYILATPTTATTDDETAGLWFTLTGSETSLDIPVAPDGWIYEGWVVVDGVPYTTGQFADPARADMFDGFSGPDSAPDKPGEDYIVNLPAGITAPLDLRGGTVVVSIEPFQEGSDPTGPMPSQVKPLTAEISADAIDHNPYDLQLSSDMLPSGSVEL